ncbi:MAG: hypothetical protein HEQ35_26780 [Gloeotrichia echinulata IR180]|jgi:hypothetical protein|nr:hypothetical protein [Gloeotrichia echinulata DEX184]
MLEKLLLAAILTFTLNLFTEMSWSNSSQTNVKINSHNDAVFTVTQVIK